MVINIINLFRTLKYKKIWLNLIPITLIIKIYQFLSFEFMK